jgi:hypothetical protein
MLLRDLKRNLIPHGSLRRCSLPQSAYALWQGISHKESFHFMTFL